MNTCTTHTLSPLYYCLCTTHTLSPFKVVLVLPVMATDGAATRKLAHGRNAPSHAHRPRHRASDSESAGESDFLARQPDSEAADSVPVLRHESMPVAASLPVSSLPRRLRRSQVPHHMSMPGRNALTGGLLAVPRWPGLGLSES